MISFTYFLNDAWFNKVDSIIASLPDFTASAKQIMNAVNSKSHMITVRGGPNGTNPFMTTRVSVSDFNSATSDAHSLDEIQVDVAYAVFELKASGSSATKLQPFIDPNSTI